MSSKPSLLFSLFPFTTARLLCSQKLTPFGYRCHVSRLTFLVMHIFVVVVVVVDHDVVVAVDRKGNWGSRRKK